MDPSVLRDLVKAATVLKLNNKPSIDRQDVRRSYRQAVKEVHPDKSGGSADAFNEVKWAYVILERYFDHVHDSANAGRPQGHAFHQPLNRDDLLFSEGDGAYFHQCRCGDLVEIATVVIALGITSYTCETCSLVYTLKHD
ncbi:DNAJ homolog subfamily C member 24, putative [Babesia ovis]|uniref:DNAJ homolog subfamily C member 24, putative n=1 Tax=Babesia ovis TaxID=5869 RepID=A0A9W5T7Z8_BABOV|nr:DNAJ homolog subfamily C member 24, putative [Babesia ovis]